MTGRLHCAEVPACWLLKNRAVVIRGQIYWVDLYKPGWLNGRRSIGRVILISVLGPRG
jgi:hypothetical protein